MGGGTPSCRNRAVTVAGRDVGNRGYLDVGLAVGAHHSAGCVPDNNPTTPFTGRGGEIKCGARPNTEGAIRDWNHTQNPTIGPLIDT